MLVAAAASRAAAATGARAGAADDARSASCGSSAIIFPEGFTRARDGRARDRGGEDRRAQESHRKVRLSGAAYSRRRRSRERSPASARRSCTLEGFLFPATYDFDRKSTSAQLVQNQLEAFTRSGARSNLSYARSKNLTPYDVLMIASMVEGEAQVPSERPLVAAVIYNRLHAHMPLGIDATIRYGLHVPPTESLTQSRARSDPTRTTRGVHTACRRRRSTIPGIAAMRRPRTRRRSTTSTSCASRTQAPLLHRELPGLPPARGPVRLLRSSRCSAIRSRTRCRPGCRTRRSRRPGSTGRTSLRDVLPEELEGGGARRSSTRT